MSKKPQRNDRIAFTPTPEARAVIIEVAALTKQSRSAVVSEIFDEVLPALKTMLDALRLAKEQPREAQRLMNNMAHRAVGELTHHQLDLDTQISGMEAQQKLNLDTDGRTMKGKRARRSTSGRAAQ